MKKVFLLEGNESERRAALEQIRGSLGDHETFIFDDDDSCDFVSHVVTELNPFSDKRRLYIIRGIPSIVAPSKTQARTKAIAELAKVVPLIPPGNFVVFENLRIEGKKFVDLIKEHGTVHQFEQIVDLADARKRATRYFESKSQSIPYDDAKFLVEILAGSSGKVDLDMLHLILLKMDHIVGKRSKVTRGDIEAAYEHSEDFVIWNLFDKLDAQDYCASLRVMMKYLHRESNFSGAVIYLMTMFYWRYGLLMCAKGGLACSLTKADIAKEISSLQKIRRTGKDRYIKYTTLGEDGKSLGPMYKEQATMGILEGRFGKKPIVNSLTFVHLAMIYYALGQAAIKIRSGCTEAETVLALQFVLMTICRRIKKRESLELLDNPELRWLKNMNAMEDALLK